MAAGRSKRRAVAQQPANGLRITVDESDLRAITDQLRQQVATALELPKRAVWCKPDEDTWPSVVRVGHTGQTRAIDGGQVRWVIPIDGTSFWASAEVYLESSLGTLYLKSSSLRFFRGVANDMQALFRAEWDLRRDPDERTDSAQPHWQIDGGGPWTWGEDGRRFHFAMAALWQRGEEHREDLDRVQQLIIWLSWCLGYTRRQLRAYNAAS